MQILDKLTINVERSLEDSFKICENIGDDRVSPKHLFIGIIKNKDNLASRLLQNMGVNIEETINSIPLEAKRVRGNVKPQFSGEVINIIEEAYSISHDLGHVYIGTEHLLLSLLKSDEYDFVKQLNIGGLSYEAIKSKLLNFANYPPGIFSKSIEREDGGRSAVSDFGQDITKLAELGSLLPIIGRDKEIDRMIKILSRRTKNNPILIGDAGVGKTAVVEGLAQRIVSNDVPESMKSKRIISIDISSIIAGSKVRGELEEKLLSLIAEVINNPNIILFIDEVHMITSNSQGNSGASDISNILKPVLTDPMLKVIGATTYSEYKRSFDDDEALSRRFQAIDVQEVEKENAIDILKGLQSQFEDFHKIKISDEAIKDSVLLSSRYIADRYLPDKAIDVVDEAAATLKINREKKYPDFHAINQKIDKIRKQKEDAVENHEIEEASRLQKKEAKLLKQKQEFEDIKGSILRRKGFVVTSEDVRSVISSWTGIPVNSLTQSDKKILKNLDRLLSDEIIGQDYAVSRVAAALKRARVGIADQNRPLSSFLFLGPTGVGKTETAKVIARELFGSEDSLIQIDMSEMMEKHSVAKLVGSPPGYIGYQEGGQLTDKVRRKPYSVVLFDEIEKAHIDVLNVLLQILEEGRLTDGKGRRVSFRNTIVILTSNIGAEDIGKHGLLGFSVNKESSTDKKEEKIDEAYHQMRDELISRLRDYLRPEFLNRLDEIIIFRGLNMDDAVTISGILLDKLNERLGEKGIKINYTKRELKLIAEHGFSKEYGARPLKRSVQELIESKLADVILEKGENLGEINIKRRGNEISLEI